jgi:hypothetical protein
MLIYIKAFLLTVLSLVGGSVVVALSLSPMGETISLLGAVCYWVLTAFFTKPVYLLYEGWMVKRSEHARH